MINSESLLVNTGDWAYIGELLIIDFKGFKNSVFITNGSDRTTYWKGFTSF